jgi:hypothetical protein
MVRCGKRLGLLMTFLSELPKIAHSGFFPPALSVVATICRGLASYFCIYRPTTICSALTWVKHSAVDALSFDKALLKPPKRTLR